MITGPGGAGDVDQNNERCRERVNVFMLGLEAKTQAIGPVGDAMTTPTDTASAARRQAHLETLGTIAEQVGEFELAIARMANDPAMVIAEAPELLGRAGNRLGDVREMLHKARRDVIEG